MIDKVKMDVKMLYDDAKVFHKAHEQDGAFDVYAYLPDLKEIMIHPHESVMISTGFSAAVPQGYFGTFVPRSGLASKEGLVPANSPAVIDVGYTGEWKVCLRNTSEATRIVKHGDRICQMMLIPIPQVEFNFVDSLEETERGSTGFGDSGKQ